MAGKEDKIEQVVYVAVVTRLEEELENEITGGWKFVDVSFSGRLPNFYGSYDDGRTDRPLSLL